MSDSIEELKAQIAASEARVRELEDRIHDLVMPTDDQERYGVTTYQELADTALAALRRYRKIAENSLHMSADHIVHELADALRDEGDK